MSIESVGPGEEEGRGGVVTLPAKVLLSLDVSMVEGHGYHVHNSFLGSHSRTGAGLVYVHGDWKNVSTRTCILWPAETYLMPNPKFCPKSAARLAVGEEPLIGIMLK